MQTSVGAALGLVLGVLLAAVLELRRYIRARKQRSTALVPVGAGGGPIAR